MRKHSAKWKLLGCTYELFINEYIHLNLFFNILNKKLCYIVVKLLVGAVKIES